LAGSRLSVALDDGGLELPAVGRVAIFAPDADFDLSALAQDQLEIVQSFHPDHASYNARGYSCVTECGTDYAASLVCLPRSKRQARALIASAEAATPNGILIVDGQKVSGVESVLREMRVRVPIAGIISKSHGKLFWFKVDGCCFSDWAQPGMTVNSDGFLTVPGIFSADAVDPASALLATHLPPKLGRVVADLGAGWGYLATQILTRESVEAVHLIEAEQMALDCSRRNVEDPRAFFHWADGTSWRPSYAVDTVVMNPPFHVGRRGDPALGQSFIATAAAILGNSGHLWMVANRHLPYETALNSLFVKVEEPFGTSKFKVLHAQRPSRLKR